jgi:hypothetical protein
MAASALNKIPLSRQDEGVPVVPPAFADLDSALLRGNGCSGLLMAKILSAGSLPVRRRVGSPGWLFLKIITTQLKMSRIRIRGY